MNDSHLFKVAREWSKKADYSGCGKPQIGCIAVYKNAILAGGFNSDKTHSMQDKYNRFRYKDCGGTYLPSKVHSELSCISKLKYLDIDFSKLHLYIYREHRDGTLAMSRCCPSCMAAIRQMGIKHIHYTTDQGFAHETLK